MKRFPQILTYAILAVCMFTMGCQKMEILPLSDTDVITKGEMAVGANSLTTSISGPQEVVTPKQKLGNAMGSATLLSSNNIILPQNAQDFMLAFFPQVSYEVVGGSYNANGNINLYAVILPNGLKLTFDKAGELEDTEHVRMESKSLISVKMALQGLPQLTQKYLFDNYGLSEITDDIRRYIEKGGITTHYHVKIIPDQELIFDIDGIFVGINS